VAATQDAYVSRFADEIALRQLQGRPMSAAQISARSAQYAGQGRRLFFESYETQGSNQSGPGWICHYVAQDDPATCSPCQRAVPYHLRTS
jgi:hypothetical protein